MPKILVIGKFYCCGNLHLIFWSSVAVKKVNLNERLNQTFVDKKRCKINEEKGVRKAWATIARECVNKYNEIEQTFTGFSPKYLLDSTNTNVLPKVIKDKTMKKEDWKTYRIEQKYQMIVIKEFLIKPGNIMNSTREVRLTQKPETGSRKELYKNTS